MQLAQIFYIYFIADDVALAVIFYVFLNIRQTHYAVSRGDKSYGQTRAQGQASGPGSALQAIHAFMPAVNTFMQPINGFMQAVSSLRPARGGDQRVHAAYQRIHAGC